MGIKNIPGSCLLWVPKYIKTPPYQVASTWNPSSILQTDIFFEEIFAQISSVFPTSQYFQISPFAVCTESTDQSSEYPQRSGQQLQQHVHLCGTKVPANQSTENPINPLMSRRGNPNLWGCIVAISKPRLSRPDQDLVSCF